MSKYPALRYLLEHPERMYPEEHEELVDLFEYVKKLEKVLKDSEGLLARLGKN